MPPPLIELSGTRRLRDLLETGDISAQFKSEQRSCFARKEQSLRTIALALRLYLFLLLISPRRESTYNLLNERMFFYENFDVRY